MAVSYTHLDVYKRQILGSDEIAEGAIEVFQEAKLRIPKDLAIVIYEDIKTLESKWEDFTRVQMYLSLIHISSVPGMGV